MQNVLSIAADPELKVAERPPSAWKSAKPVERLNESLPYRLRELHSEMLQEGKKAPPWWLRSDRIFRQKFCNIVRTWSGLTHEETCDYLNQHPQVLALRKLPGASSFYPVTPEFLERLESKIHSIIEYNPYGGGFLGVGMMGVPTNILAIVIAEASGTMRHYRRFEDWCRELMARECPTTNRNGPT